MNSLQIPAAGCAEVRVLHDGNVGLDRDDERVSGTVTTLILDGDAVIVVDPGMADGPEEDPLGADQAAPAAGRRLLLEFADVIIPGHRAPFRPGTRA